MTFPALTHIAIPVSDLDVSTRWCTKQFGAEPVLDEKRTGLDHVASAISPA